MKPFNTTRAWKLTFLFSIILLTGSFYKTSAQVTLGSSPYTQDFNSIGSGLPTGWTVRTGATNTALGSTATLVTATTSWASTTGQFNNAASANPPALSTDNAATQAARTDRALAVRQSGAFGDPGAAFVLQIANTSGLTSFTLSFKLMELDPTATVGRTTTWNVDYGFGASPSSFTNATTVPAILTTFLGSGWGTTNVTVNFGSVLDNNSGPVWIRVAAKNATTGSGSRPISAVDDFSLSYVSALPVLNAGALASFGNVCINTIAGPNSFSLSGSNLNGSPVTVGPLTGYSFSETSGGLYTASVSPAYVAPNLSATVFVKFSPILVQSYNGSIPVAGGGASTSVSATGAGISSPPTVTTGSAGSILYNGATLPGTIDDFGCSSITGYGIEYSTTNGFANGSGTDVPASNLAGNNFSSVVTSLLPNVTYYFHAYATNGGGTSYGSQASFTTAQLDAPVATAATSVANTSFDANWNSVTDATGYRLDVATTSTFYAPASTAVAEWNFPNNPDDNIADGGIAPNLTRQVNAVGPTGTFTYVPVAGSTTSTVTGPGWDGGIGNYSWEINIVTAGYYNLKVSSSQRSSNTGPRDFKLQYKIGAGGTYADVPGGTVVVANNWTSGLLTTVSLPAICENKISVFLRWVMATNTAVNLGAVGAAGTSAIDNISIIGNPGTFVPGYNNLSVAGLSQTVNSGLVANTEYFYRVRATGGASTSDHSNVISVTTTCTAPVIGACPADIEQCDDGVVFWTDPTATGDPAVSVNCVPSSGSTFSIGTTVVTCTATNGCGLPSDCSFNVTINESPVIGSCPTDIETCNPTVFFTDPSSTGTSPVVTCTPPSGSTFPAGLTIVTCEALNSCGTSSCSFNVTVNDPSVAPASASASLSTICPGDPTTLSVSGGSLGTGASWRWYSGSCGGTLVGIGANVSVSPVVTTTYFVRAEGDCNTTSCESTTVTVRTLSTDPTTATSNAPVNGVCIGSSVMLSVSGGSLGDNSDWLWYEDGCGNGASIGTGSSISVTPSFEGLHSYYVRAEGPCNTTNCAAVSVLVGTYSVEATSITSSVIGNSICTGNNITLTLNGGFLGTVAQWQWYSGSCGGTLVATGTTSVTVSPIATTTYYVRAEGSCNNTICASLTVNVSSVAPTNPPPTITTAPNGICSGNGSTVACNAVPGATFYSWSAPNGTTFDGGNPSPYISTSNSVQVTFGNLPNGVSGYDICVFAGNGCGNTVTKCRYIRGRVQTAQTITGNASSCPNTNSVYSIVSLPGADTYTWTVTGAATINGGGTSLTTTATSVTVNFLAGWTNGTLSVYGSMSCGYSGPAKTITIISTPVMPGVMTGPSLVCPNGTYAYSIAPVAGALSYNWSTNVPSAIISPAGTSCSITFPSVIPAGSTVSVTATGSCGTSAPRVKNIATGLSNTPGTISGPAMGQCGQTGVSYSILPVAGATSYLWTATNGATISGLNNITVASVDFPAAFTTSDVSVVAINTCGNSAPQTILVTGAPGSPGLISGSQSVCSGTPYSYSVAGSTGATSYVWSTPPGSIILSGQFSASIQVLFDVIGGNVSVYASNACGNSTTSNLAVSVICRLAQISQGSLTDAMLYPNPTVGTTTLKFETITAGDYKVSVVDITGQVMQSKTVTAVAGLNLHELDLGTYAKGLYMVRLEREGEAMQMLRVTVE